LALYLLWLPVAIAAYIVEFVNKSSDTCYEIDTMSYSTYDSYTSFGAQPSQDPGDDILFGDNFLLFADNEQVAESIEVRKSQNFDTRNVRGQVYV
jgi:hypothetical protein